MTAAAGGDGSTASARPATASGAGSFGPNAWLVEDMYDRYRADPSSVSDSWREFFADYRPAGGPLAPPSTSTQAAPLVT
ncbi:MAG: 2-oxoglutarate dehydrogenase E1 subunit family protein, partial [Acidimicrobiales bacterium]